MNALSCESACENLTCKQRSRHTGSLLDQNTVCIIAYAKQFEYHGSYHIMR